MTEGQIKKKLTFILHELAIVEHAPQDLKNRLIGRDILIPKELFQILRRFFTIVPRHLWEKMMYHVEMRDLGAT